MNPKTHLTPVRTTLLLYVKESLFNSKSKNGVAQFEKALFQIQSILETINPETTITEFTSDPSFLSSLLGDCFEGKEMNEIYFSDEYQDIVKDTGLDILQYLSLICSITDSELETEVLEDGTVIAPSKVLMYTTKFLIQAQRELRSLGIPVNEGDVLEVAAGQEGIFICQCLQWSPSQLIVETVHFNYWTILG